MNMFSLIQNIEILKHERQSKRLHFTKNF
jgi:hypothetical protein